MDVDPQKIWLKYSYWPVPIWRFWGKTMDLSTGSQDLRCDQLSMFACQTHKYVDLLRMKQNDQQYYMGMSETGVYRKKTNQCHGMGINWKQRNPCTSCSFLFLIMARALKKRMTSIQSWDDGRSKPKRPSLAEHHWVCCYSIGIIGLVGKSFKARVSEGFFFSHTNRGGIWMIFWMTIIYSIYIYIAYYSIL